MKITRDDRRVLLRLADLLDASGAAPFTAREREHSAALVRRLADELPEETPAIDPPPRGPRPKPGAQWPRIGGDRG